MNTTLKILSALAVALIIPADAAEAKKSRSLSKLLQVVKPNAVQPLKAKPRQGTRRRLVVPNLSKPRLNKPMPALANRKHKHRAQQQGSSHQTKAHSLGNSGANSALRIPDVQTIARAPKPALPRFKTPSKKQLSSKFDAGPQPEPPTVQGNLGFSSFPGSNGPGTGLKDRAGHFADLRAAEEIARIGNIKDSLGWNKAIDDSSIGGGRGGRGSRFDGKGMVPDSNTADEGPQNNNIWRPEAPGGSAYNPGMDGGQGFTPPPRQRRNADNLPGFNRRPGRAGDGLRFGPGGETSQDGRPTRNGNGRVWDTEEGDQIPPSHDREMRPASDGQDHGSVTRVRNTFLDYGTSTVEVTIRRFEDGTREVSRYQFGSGVKGKVVHEMYYPSGSRRREVWVNGEQVGVPTYVLPEVKVTGSPDTSPEGQPNPEETASGEELGCPASHRDCGKTAESVPWQNKVSQPGAEDTEPVDGFTASIAERKDVVTNPVDPNNYVRNGGGDGTPRPIEWVTGPGK